MLRKENKFLVNTFSGLGSRKKIGNGVRSLWYHLEGKKTVYYFAVGINFRW